MNPNAMDIGNEIGGKLQKRLTEFGDSSPKNDYRDLHLVILNTALDVINRIYMIEDYPPAEDEEELGPDDFIENEFVHRYDYVMEYGKCIGYVNNGQKEQLYRTSLANFITQKIERKIVKEVSPKIRPSYLMAIYENV